MTLTREAHPVARKAHRCTCCTKQIQIGEKYRLLVVIDRGEVGAWKQCSACADDEVTHRASRYWDLDDGVTHDDVIEWAENVIAHEPADHDDYPAAERYMDRYDEAS